MKVFSFCENISAGSLSLWHIRELTEKGKKLGGGADTSSLCGSNVCWDIDVEITEFHLSVNTCKKCLEKFKELKNNA